MELLRRICRAGDFYSWQGHAECGDFVWHAFNFYFPSKQLSQSVANGQPQTVALDCTGCAFPLESLQHGIAVEHFRDIFGFDSRSAV